MKYVKQTGVILLFSVAGELLQHFLPFPIPASVYGIVLLFLALNSRLLPKEAVKGSGTFLASLLPLLFVVPIVGIVDNLSLIAQNLFPIIVIIILPTVLTFGVSGLVAQKLLKKEEKHHE